MGFLREGLTQEGYDRDYTTRELMQRIGSYFRPSWVRLSVIMVLVALIALMGAAVPILVARGVEQMELGAGATRATAIGRRPEAMGRSRFVGWRRSPSTSRRSLRM